MGCVYYYVLSHGKHPFGDALHRQANIMSGEYKLNCLQNDNQLAVLLIEKMIDKSPYDRPSVNAVLKHPIFWSEQKILSFFQDVSDRIEKEDVDNFVLKTLEENSLHVVKGDWRVHIDSEVAQDLRKYRNYRGNSVRDLLRALRNKKHHYRELSEQAQKNLGEIPQKFVRYWTSRFPLLLIHTWLAMQCVKKEPIFNVYYDKHYNFPDLPKQPVNHNYELNPEGFLFDKNSLSVKNVVKRDRSPNVKRDRSPYNNIKREASPNPNLLMTNWRVKANDNLESWRNEPKNLDIANIPLDYKNPWFQNWLLSDFRDDNAFIKWRESEFYKNLPYHRSEREDTPPFVPEFPSRDLCERLRQRRRVLEESQLLNVQIKKSKPRRNYVKRNNSNRKNEEQNLVWSVPPPP